MVNYNKVNFLKTRLPKRLSLPKFSNSVLAAKPKVELAVKAGKLKGEVLTSFLQQERLAENFK